MLLWNRNRVVVKQGAESWLSHSSVVPSPRSSREQASSFHRVGKASALPPHQKLQTSLLQITDRLDIQAKIFLNLTTAHRHRPTLLVTTSSYNCLTHTHTVLARGCGNKRAPFHLAQINLQIGSC